MLFKDVSELQNFLIWAKAQKILKLRVQEVEVEFSGLALIEGMTTSQSVGETLGIVPLTPEQQKKDEEDLLFHSAT